MPKQIEANTPLTNNKTIAKNTLFMYFRMFLIMVVGIYTSRVVFATLGIEDYGLYNVIGGIIAMFGFLNSAMGNTTSRFITFHLEKRDLNKQVSVFSTAVEIHFIIALIILILGETVGLWYLYNKLVIPEGRFTAAFWLYQLSIASTIISIVSVPYNAAIIAHEKMSVFAYISIMDAVLKLIIVYFLAIAPFDKLIFYGSLIFLIQILDRIVYGIYCGRHFPETKLKLSWEKDLFKEIFSYAGWNMMGGFAYVFFTQGINLLLNLFCGTAVNAARGIAVQVESIVKQFASNVQTAINPQIIKSYAQNNLERMHSLVCASSRYCFFLLFIITLPIMLEIKYLLHLWLGDYPDHTVNFVRIILANVILDTLVNPLWTANAATGKVKIYQITVNSISLLFIPIAFLVIKYSNVPESLFLCTVISTIVCTIARLFIVMKQISLNFKYYFINVLFKISSVTLIASIIPVAVHSFTHKNLVGFILVGICSVFSAGITIYSIGLTSEEKVMLTKKSRNIYKEITKFLICTVIVGK